MFSLPSSECILDMVCPSSSFAWRIVLTCSLNNCSYLFLQPTLARTGTVSHSLWLTFGTKPGKEDHRLPSNAERQPSKQHSTETMKTTAVIGIPVFVALLGMLMNYLKQNSPLGEDLLYAVRGEVMGEQFFRMAHYASSDADYKHKYKLLWQLETQTKQRLNRYCQEHSLSVPWLLHAYDVLEGNLGGFLWTVLTPKGFAMAFLRDDTAGAMKYYQRLVNMAAAQTKSNTSAEKKVFDYVLDHEIAINYYAAMEVDGKTDVSIKKVAALIGDPRLS